MVAVIIYAILCRVWRGGFDLFKSSSVKKQKQKQKNNKLTKDSPVDRREATVCPSFDLDIAYIIKNSMCLKLISREVLLYPVAI